MTNINSELSYTIFQQRESGQQHLPYEVELEFFDMIKSGEVELLKKYPMTLTKKGFGKLSNNPLRNSLYHYIVAVALITRFCMENGLDGELAYTLSDLYIQKGDVCTNLSDLEALHREMIFDFAERMRAIKKKNIYSKKIVQSLDYIHAHLHEKIMVDDLAEELELNKTYLCTLFKKETGLTIAQYIENERIEAAKNMLTYSDYSFIDISNYLNFNSHSHFIKVFKKHTGMTPREFSNKHYRAHWQE